MNRRKSRVERNWGFAKGGSEMFGPAKAFTKKYLKNMDVKRRSWQLCSLLVTVCILVFVFSVSPKHLDIRLPRNEDLLETPMLRGQEGFDYKENHYLKERIIHFLLESCSQLKSYDMLFCHNVLVNGQPLQEPCFAVCKEKAFYANVQVSTTDDAGLILCTETYAELTEQKRRPSTVVLNGQRFQTSTDEESGQTSTDEESGEMSGQMSGQMVDFTRIPKTGVEVCSFQHAVDIVKGTWIASE